ncbi:MAG: MoaD/ThiS family protein [Deltaproteobacteria bacterium]|jgi:thiamine biosynthesis protein ThiS|nr:MoaD/ThiS family protein [Deltaproteobacteria bacterium]MBW2238234.1 MoaD/ThiS family protein [Deltaproteobacteria bacterium]MBW2571236.1 MoaD/ThiS family protein [Deltaproteobacteria bacterium]MBW2668434.1 MoaD/ThiS family protein [Deltaproteobacteria bacterium]
MMLKVNGEQRSWYEGMTVADLLRDIGESNHYAVVRINDKHVSRPYFEKTQIPENSEMFLIPLIAGG